MNVEAVTCRAPIGVGCNLWM